MTDAPSPQAVRLREIVHAWLREDTPLAIKFQMTNQVAEKLIARLSASPALAAETGGGAVAPRGEVTDEWADRFCEAVNWSPDGQECKVVEGEMRCVTFRQIAKGHILAAIATGPEAPPAGGGLDREAVARALSELKRIPAPLTDDGEVTSWDARNEVAVGLHAAQTWLERALVLTATEAKPEGEGA